MKDKDSHGSHGGNRGSGDSRKDDPNARGGGKAESEATSRNEDRAGGKVPGEKSRMQEE